MIKSLPNLYSYIGLVKEEAKAITVENASFYSPKTQPKKKFGENQIDKYGDTQFRNLEVPQFRLKMVQTKINKLLKQIPLPDNMYGSVIGKDNIKHAGQHLNHTHFLTIDLKDFFTKINYRTVFRIFLSHGFSYDTANVLTQLTTLRGVLPQGAPSSPVIANLVALDMTREISTFIKPFNITFTTYLDDLCFSSNSNFKVLVPKILAIIRKNYFFPAYKKIHYRTKCCEITGLIVHGNELKITQEMKMKSYTNIDLRAYVERVKKYNLNNQIK
ncbi:MAG: reverse transcriptase family protein [Ferruginibacter sp.]